MTLDRLFAKPWDDHTAIHIALRVESMGIRGGKHAE